MINLTNLELHEEVMIKVTEVVIKVIEVIMDNNTKMSLDLVVVEEANQEPLHVEEMTKDPLIVFPILEEEEVKVVATIIMVVDIVEEVVVENTIIDLNLQLMDQF